MIELLPDPEQGPCDECGSEDGTMLLVITCNGVITQGLALCPACRIRTEATLRGARKAGPHIPKGGGK